MGCSLDPRHCLFRSAKAERSEQLSPCAAAVICYDRSALAECKESCGNDTVKADGLRMVRLSSLCRAFSPFKWKRPNLLPCYALPFVTSPCVKNPSNTLCFAFVAVPLSAHCLPADVASRIQRAGFNANISMGVIKLLCINVFKIFKLLKPHKHENSKDPTHAVPDGSNYPLGVQRL